MTAFENHSLLRAFVSIVESGSISAGARRLKVSQPTLSRQLRELEDLCGTALLRRDTHQMNVTEAGRRFLAEARAILLHAEEAHQRLRADSTTLSGHLRVFATLDCGQFVVTQLVSQFLKDHPRLTMSLALTNRPLHMIQEGCDVGILPGRITDESVVARPAGFITLHLAASPSLLKGRPAARRPADLKTWPWISLAGRQFWSSREVRLVTQDGTEQTFPISPVLISEGVTSTREAVRAGLGVAALPDWLVEEDLRTGRLVRLLPRWKTHDLPLHVVYLGQRFHPARVSSFIDFAVRYLKKELEPPKARSRRPAARIF